MGWLRLVASLELQVSFAKEPYERDYILQKRPVISSILLTVATPYQLYTRVLQSLVFYSHAQDYTTPVTSCRSFFAKEPLITGLFPALLSFDSHSCSLLLSHIVQPIADRVALNLEILSKNFQFSTKRKPSFSWDLSFITWY